MVLKAIIALGAIAGVLGVRVESGRRADAGTDIQTSVVQNVFDLQDQVDALRARVDSLTARPSGHHARR